ncbi:hypothetical protein OUZ56_009914 [Daphnia magna]|uniref:Uncharacterized protein n=1 Tax=Daphnia magna TaxID=35525 RepID=A0ABR0AHB8_9CRUS|nr:hypothetical protein OUZ56_009914 [Daphnia magna]
MILLPNGCRLLLLLGFVSPVRYFSSLFRSAFPQRSTARPRPPTGCTSYIGYPPTTPCHEPSPSVSDSLHPPYVLLSYHLLPAILTLIVSCRTLRLTVHFSASCRKLQLTVDCPVLAEHFGSRFTALILADHFGSRFPLSTLPQCTRLHRLNPFHRFPLGVSPSLCFPRLYYGRSRDPVPQQFKVLRPVGWSTLRGPLQPPPPQHRIEQKHNHKRDLPEVLHLHHLLSVQKKPNPRLPSCPRDPSRRFHPELSSELSGGESTATGQTQDTEISTSIENLATSDEVIIQQSGFSNPEDQSDSGSDKEADSRQPTHPVVPVIGQHFFQTPRQQEQL